MYIAKNDGLTCRCGLNVWETDFVDENCIICYVDDYSCTCILCGFIDNHEFFVNFLCHHCAAIWCAE
jgi:hypothetical protein